MKKILKMLVLAGLLIFSRAALADTTTPASSQATTESSATTPTSASSNAANANSTASSTAQSSSSSSSEAKQATQTKKATKTAKQTAQTPASTTAQAQKAAPAHQETNNPVPTENTGGKAGTSTSTTIIKETVNHNEGSKNNIFLIILSSLSALVTIVGGIIAIVKHLRSRVLKAKNKTRQTPKASSHLADTAAFQAHTAPRLSRRQRHS